MRRTVSAVVAALGMCAASGAALADEVNGFEQKVITPSGLHVVSLHRYAYNFAGKKLDSERICNGAPTTSVREYRTTKDIVYSVFSLGWYTPKTADVVCQTSRASL